MNAALTNYPSRTKDTAFPSQKLGATKVIERIKKAIRNRAKKRCLGELKIFSIGVRP